MRRIVAHDPIGEVNTGTFIEGTNEATRLENRGVVLMPISDGFGYRAFDGYFRRDWGPGWKYENNRGTRGCSMVIEVATDHKNIYWCARVEPIDSTEGLDGRLKLTTDSSNSPTLSGGMRAKANPVDLRELPKPDSQGGWTLGGWQELNLTISGMVGLNVFGVCRNTRVVWSAVSQSNEEVPGFLKGQLI